jgi:hypothetical protein
MTFLRRHDAEIALRQAAETGITVTLAEAFTGDTTAMYAFDLLQVFDPDVFTKPVIQAQLLPALEASVSILCRLP